MRNRISLIAGVITLGTLAACADKTPTSPAAGNTAPPPILSLDPRSVSMETECTANAQGELSCGRVRPSAVLYDVAADTTYKVKVSGSIDCITDDPNFCTAQLQFRNEMSQPLGTADGQTPHINGVRVYIQQSSVSPAGSVQLAGQPTPPNPPFPATGRADCVVQASNCPLPSGTQHPYFQFNEMWAPFTTTTLKNIGFNQGAGGVDVTSFRMVIVGRIPEEATTTIRRWVQDQVFGGTATQTSRNINAVFGRRIVGTNQLQLFAAGDSAVVWRAIAAMSGCTSLNTNPQATCTWGDNGKSVQAAAPFGAGIPSTTNLRTVWGDSVNGNDVFAAGFQNTIVKFGSRRNGASNNTNDWKLVDLSGTKMATVVGTVPTIWYGSWGDTTQACFGASAPSGTAPNTAARVRMLFVGSNSRIARLQGPACSDSAGASVADRDAMWSTNGNGITVPYLGVSTHLTSAYGLTGNGVQTLQAVGTGGTIIRSDDGGSTWINETNGSVGHLYGIWGVDSVATVGQVRIWYAMGRVTSTGAGILLRKATGINGNATSTGWVNVTAQVPVVNRYFWGIHGSSASDFYIALGGGDVVHFNGTGWRVHSTGQSNTLFGLWSTSLAGSGSPRLVAVGASGRVIRGVP